MKKYLACVFEYFMIAEIRNTQDKIWVHLKSFNEEFAVCLPIPVVAGLLHWKNVTTAFIAIQNDS